MDLGHMAEGAMHGTFSTSCLPPPIESTWAREAERPDLQTSLGQLCAELLGPRSRSSDMSRSSQIKFAISELASEDQGKRYLLRNASK